MHNRIFIYDIIIRLLCAAFSDISLATGRERNVTGHIRPANETGIFLLVFRSQASVMMKLDSKVTRSIANRRVVSFTMRNVLLIFVCAAAVYTLLLFLLHCTGCIRTHPFDRCNN